MRTDLIRYDDIVWQELDYAARFSGIRAVAIRAMIVQGAIQSLDHQHDVWIPRPVAMRLKRETRALLGLNRRRMAPDASLRDADAQQPPAEGIATLGSRRP